MSAAMGQPVGCQLTELSGFLRAEFGYSTATELGELYRALAVTCIEKQILRVLIIAGDDDPAGERALRAALMTMVLAGIPDGFRLALVTPPPRVAHTYRNLNPAGIRTGLFENEDDALRWLHGPDPVPRQAA